MAREINFEKYVENRQAGSRQCTQQQNRKSQRRFHNVAK
jgi:hypothetical protein